MPPVCNCSFLVYWDWIHLSFTEWPWLIIMHVHLIPGTESKHWDQVRAVYYIMKKHRTTVAEDIEVNFIHVYDKYVLIWSTLNDQTAHALVCRTTCVPLHSYRTHCVFVLRWTVSERHISRDRGLNICWLKLSVNCKHAEKAALSLTSRPARCMLLGILAQGKPVTWWSRSPYKVQSRPIGRYPQTCLCGRLLYSTCSKAY
jgi:hypothetical protein